MDSERLDSLIHDFERMVRSAISQYSVREGHYIASVTTRDWGPFFARAKEIQEGFNSRVRYPSKRERDEAWIRFNDLRTQVYEHANKQRSDFRADSEALRDQILNSLHSSEYNYVADAAFFFLPETTVEDMKLKGEELKKASQMLSSNKHRMLKEHKDECFARILEVRQTHDVFWGQYKQHLATKRGEAEQRRSEVADRVRSNIRANAERLEKALDAHARVRANLESNLEKLESARSVEFAARVAEWIAEDKEKLRSIAESIERLEEWIGEDKARLDDIRSRNSR